MVATTMVKIAALSVVVGARLCTYSYLSRGQVSKEPYCKHESDQFECKRSGAVLRASPQPVVQQLEGTASKYISCQVVCCTTVYIGNESIHGHSMQRPYALMGTLCSAQMTVN